MEPNYPNRIKLAHLPTPIERLKRLSNHLAGPEVLIKRDDQTGLALGGNKSRKLEFLCADALAQNSNHLITCGAAQSNHCRQTAAAAAHLGLGCSLVLSGNQPGVLQGNALISKLLGAQLHWTGNRSADIVMLEVAEGLQSLGQTPYTIPRGGSNPLGAIGYVWAMKELAEQLAEQNLDPDFIILASSSGGTHAGAVIGKKVYKLRGQILGISIEYQADFLTNHVVTLAAETASYLGVDHDHIADLVMVNDEYLGQGYGIISDVEREAIQLLAELEGILLDPVYTGRAMGGLIQQIRQGRWRSDHQILFWHTGGTPAILGVKLWDVSEQIVSDRCISGRQLLSGQ